MPWPMRRGLASSIFDIAKEHAGARLVCGEPKTDRALLEPAREHCRMARSSQKD
jgi:hypothetical protein